MAHDHHDIQGKKLLLTILLNIAITIAEFIGGIFSNSLALISDAFHNLSDVIALLLSYLARRYSHKKPDTKHTFGYKRIEILAALFNSALLIAISIFLFVEAWHRFWDPQEIKAGILLIVASIGLIANFLSILILHSKKQESLNIKSAYLHLLGDTLSSVAVIIGGLLIFFWNIRWIDPLITVLVAIYLIAESWKVVKQASGILMQSGPSDIKLQEICTQIEQLPDISGIHHVHLWNLNEKEVHFEAHIDLKIDITVSQSNKIIEDINRLLSEKFSIHHTSLQMEYNVDHPKEIINQT